MNNFEVVIKLKEYNFIETLPETFDFFKRTTNKQVINIMQDTIKSISISNQKYIPKFSIKEITQTEVTLNLESFYNLSEEIQMIIRDLSSFIYNTAKEIILTEKEIKAKIIKQKGKQNDENQTRQSSQKS